MKKKLFTLLLCAFAVVSAKAYTVTDNGDGSVTIYGGGYETITQNDSHGDQHTVVSGVEGAGLPNSFTDAEKAIINNATKLILTGYIDNMLAFQETSNGNKTSVDMSEAHFQQNLSSTKTVTYDKYDPSSSTGTTSVTKTYMLNVMSFQKFPNAQDIKLSKYVESLSAELLKENKLNTTFEIPESVKYLDTHVVLTTPITNITIPANVEYINSEAFMNADISALIDVTVKGYTAAGNSAFDYMVTVGQTNSDYQKYANLHFPEGAEKFFTNTNHPLTQKESLSKKAFQEWLSAHKDYSGANGWQQFINAGSGTPTPTPDGKKVVLRTFSDKVARLVPLNFRAYIVTGLKEHKDGYAVKLVQIFAIPANTGVILYGEVNENSTGYTLGRIPTWDPGESGYVPPYNRKSTEVSGVDQEGTVTITNYLVPTVTETTLYPAYKSTSIWDAAWPLSGDMKQYTNGTKVTDRNFIMSKFGGTSLKEAKNVTDANNYVGFFRVKANVKCGPNKAYLSLPATLYDSAEGAEAIVVRPTDPASMIFRAAEWNLAVSTGNWGTRDDNLGPLHAKFAGFEEEVTGISNVSTESVSDNGYYTLQGVKVSQPQKGVYVKNGKKVIIK